MPICEAVAASKDFRLRPRLHWRLRWSKGTTNQSVFVAGWRPFVGWVCGIAFAYSFIIQPAAQSIAVLLHSSFDVSKLPNLNGSDLSTILFGMLGLGAMRSYDKANGTGSGH